MKQPEEKIIDPYLKKLGARITALMEAKGITQLEMADQLKTQNTQVRRIQRGEVNSTILMLRKVAKILKVPVTKLLED